MTYGIVRDVMMVREMNSLMYDGWDYSGDCTGKGNETEYAETMFGDC